MSELVPYGYKSLTQVETPPESNNEYVSLCGDCIVYRNVNSTNIFKWIKEVQMQYSRSCALLLVRQLNNNVQLLWTGTIPQAFWFNRRRPTYIVSGKEKYLVLSSISIGQEEP